MTSSIMGVGATRRLSAVRWSVAQQVALAWVLTIPGAAISAFVTYYIANAVVG
jgi:PiT family inorganic phosphate transporter